MFHCVKILKYEVLFNPKYIKKKSKKVFLSITKPTTVYSKPQIARKDFHYKSRPEYDILVIFSSQLMRGGHLEHRPIIKQREERVQENQ